MTSPTEPEVVTADEQEEVAVDVERWATLARRVLRAEGHHGELTLTFVDRAEITELNREHMGVDGPTDVLSFPLDASSVDGPTGDSSASVGPLGAPVLLGDVVICPAVAADSAPTHAGSIDDELALLVVHGVLHVLGHDHTGADDSARMRERERLHLETHHWGGPAPASFSFDHRDNH